LLLLLLLLRPAAGRPSLQPARRPARRERRTILARKQITHENQR